MQKVYSSDCRISFRVSINTKCQNNKNINIKSLVLSAENVFNKLQNTHLSICANSAISVHMRIIKKANKKRENAYSIAEWFYKNRYGLALLLIVIFGIYLNLAFFYGPSWINGSDNYIYTAQAYTLAQGHPNQLNCGIIDCVNYIVVGGIAIFFVLLGYGLFAASLFGILCYLLTILVVYLIGKQLYGQLAGILSAFFFSIFPLVISQSSNVGDDIPMILLVSLSVLLLILALNRPDGQKKYFLLAGFVSAINFLTISEAIIAVFFIFTYIISLLLIKKDRRLIIGLCLYVCGVILAFILIALIGVYETGNPMFVMNVYTTNLNTLFPNQTTAFFNYLGDIFPTFTTKTLAELSFGYFGYLFAICAIYLIAIKYKKAIIIGYWYVFSFLYLSFGTQSISNYNPVLYAGPRFMLIFVPAITIIIGITFAKIIDWTKNRKPKIKFILYAMVCIIIITIFISSVANIIYINYSQLYSTEPLLQLGGYINNLPANAVVYGPVDIPWSTYVNPKRQSVALGYSSSQTNCSGVFNTFQMPKGAFLLGNVTDYKKCSLELIYMPYAYNWLKNYTAFVPWGPNFYEYSIYEYNPTQNSSH